MSFPFAMLLAEGGESLHLAVSMLIIFGSAKLLAELFERLGQPGLIGEILAGILIGPAVLNWVQPSDFTATMAGLGVMFLLFRVGLDVEAPELIKVGGTALLVGVSGVVVPFLCGWIFYVSQGKSQLESFFLGTALTATSVGITAQVLAAKGLLHRTASRIILAAAIIDDILALLLLGVVASLAKGRLDVLQLSLTTAMALIFVILVVRWGQKTLNQVVEKLEGNLRVGEAQFALAMILMFALAALAVKVGVAAIIGAFLAGLALADAVPKRVHDLTHGVTELLVPFFLVDIGLHFQLGVFQDWTSWKLALLIIPIAVLSKMIGCGLGAFSHGRAIAIRVGIGMIPRGEFCMVVAQIGLSLGAISGQTFAVIVFMAIFAAMLTPPLLKIAFRGVLAVPPPEQEVFHLG
ncbi:MAG: cation:proton antiporter [Bryobacterales bacterium]|nr:cation:proton antiporter [Bryobacterales bacterium]